ncbi:MAG: glycosyltransferase family 4 protein [Phycisphaeraceae bacterium]|nr:glycosyltransferase family 4 protein [Phycisphaeraceae bacterium]
MHDQRDQNEQQTRRGGCLRVAIVADHASSRFGGEAALPLHYFRVLTKRGVPTWLVVHERVRGELRERFPEQRERICFVADRWWHRGLYKISQVLPARLAYFTTGLAMRLLTQGQQRKIVRELIKREGVSIVHQPMPVSPLEPSLLFGLGVPVVIGPLNGAMSYPRGFRHLGGLSTRVMERVGRWLLNGLNVVIPGKRQAEVVLVANPRTQKGLPWGAKRRAEELVENGVDFALFQPRTGTADREGEKKKGESEISVGEGFGRGDLRSPAKQIETSGGASGGGVKFVFLGRLVDWKCVDILLEAFAGLPKDLAAQLHLIGDGPERARLEAMRGQLGLTDRVTFWGWLSQEQCAARLREMDVLVLPSVLECGGAVVLEAMATGLAVISVEWGGPADYVDASCGVLVRPDSPAALRESLSGAMARLGRSPQLRQEMGQKGRRKVEEIFDWERKVDRILTIYERAGGGGRI